MAKQVWGHAVTQLCSAQGFQSVSVPTTFGNGCPAWLPPQPQCWGPCSPSAGVPASLGIPAELGWEVAWTLGLRAPGWFPCAARVRTAVSPHSFKLANPVPQRHIMGSCLVFPQSFLFCPRALPLCSFFWSSKCPVCLLDTSRGSSTVLYLDLVLRTAL